ncbi:hypothetical protein HCN50_00520 [Bradyrhizobium sp. WSM 1744]|uniref:Uncharacterized protein n=2 Tax=Bradyrhizobium TaxID=374 RepID=A0A7Y4GTF0_9BRAD|nr:hypothetical protein [Bradyrhizobium australiense]NOJ41541.1 hypothetical protein [Bradyrhizobium australiense]NOJ44754.1 hypothetical protein [Bradyrhizobium archetypum]
MQHRAAEQQRSWPASTSSREDQGGLILSTGAIKESVWHGTVDLVLKKGETAFKDEPETGTYFHG